MASVLHSFLQSISAVIVLGFMLQISFISQSTLYLNLIDHLHSSTIFAGILLINKLTALILLFVLTLIFIIKTFLKSPSYLKNISSLIYFSLGFALLGFAKLTLGELNPFTLGFVGKNKILVGSELAVEHNVIRIRDYSTMYSSPNGYFYFFILLVNLLGIRAFRKIKRSGEAIETKLPSRAEIVDSKIMKNRRKSIDLDDNSLSSNRNNQLESTRKFELFEKEFSIQSDENLSQADSNTSNVKSCLLYTSPSPRDLSTSRMPSSA